MEFEEKIKEFVNRLPKLKDVINTEEATKTSLILPFFQILGYDIFNPNEFIPEFVADVGIKKGEKVDYAISINNQLSILIEAKSINTFLQKHDSQLFRYFGTSTAKLAILTNGINYKFYTDLDEVNKMDTIPFLEIDLLNLKENDISELKKFCKDLFNIDSILNTASNLRYASSIEKILCEEFTDPSDDFIKLILSKGIYDGIKTQNVIDKYKPILKKSINHYITKKVNERLQNALNTTKISEQPENDDSQEEIVIITTTEELECFYVVKSILAEITNPQNLFYKDTFSYFGILFENKVTKWVCRVFIKENTKYIIIPDQEKNEIRYDIKNISDIYKYKIELIERLKSFLK